jgi:hypothetical protein
VNWKLQLIDEWKSAHKFASVQFSTVFALLFALVPVVAEHWTDIAPVLLKLFPSNGHQWVPVAGLLIVIVARVIQKVPADAPPTIGGTQ